MVIVVPAKAVIRLLLGIALLSWFFVAGCSRSQPPQPSGRLTVVTTLFPLYDFVRNIGGDSVTVQLLLPPGVESHSYEPRPEDLARAGKADLFIFTSNEMEPWAERIFAALPPSGRPTKVEAGAAARYLSSPARSGDDGHGHARVGGRDPHIWLDLSNAKVMVDAIAGAMADRNPHNRDKFLANAEVFKKRLDTLDDRFRSGLATCETREFLHGGHYAFAYLANRYNLSYLSAYGVTADTEPTPQRMMALVQNIRKHNLKYIFYEELLAPRVADTIARETGAATLRLHGIHNLTRDDFDKGASFVGLMEQNLTNLRKGLGCR